MVKRKFLFGPAAASSVYSVRNVLEKSKASTIPGDTFAAEQHSTAPGNHLLQSAPIQIVSARV
jgi:hypothetical protein